MPADAVEQKVRKALDGFRIELPSWGFANTGTRFGKFQQAAAATTTAEKLSDAGQVHRFTGCCPTVAVHVLWDFPDGKFSVPEVMLMAERYGVKIGAINPNVFQEQIYKHGSLGNPDPSGSGSLPRTVQRASALTPEANAR
jgi:L-rhamnose isomerase / sugar isomerase